MNKEEKLLSMLQPKDYISKLRLYCNNCKASITVKDKLKEFVFEDNN